jgi:hypothetical protein
MSNRRIAKLSVVLGGTVLLAGCSNWAYQPPIHGNFMTEPLNYSKAVAGGPPAGGNFVQESAHDYVGFATMLTHSGHQMVGDWADVDYFSRKALAAESGQVVPPEDNANWAIPLEYPYGFRTQMSQQRVRLVNDLDRGGRDRFPALAARTHVAYDCWIERTEGDWAKEFDGQCHKDYVASITELELDLDGKPAAQKSSHEYNVYFEFDKSALTTQAHEIVDHRRQGRSLRYRSLQSGALASSRRHGTEPPRRRRRSRQPDRRALGGRARASRPDRSRCPRAAQPRG